jgi:hypothetical protein
MYPVNETGCSKRTHMKVLAIPSEYRDSSAPVSPHSELLAATHLNWLLPWPLASLHWRGACGMHRKHGP